VARVISKQSCFEDLENTPLPLKKGKDICKIKRTANRTKG